MHSILLSASMQTTELVTKSSYIIGAVIAVLILVYLVYSMFKPEKF